MKKHDEYGEERLEEDIELDYDAAPIKRPQQRVIAMDADVGYGEAPTSDKDLMTARIEKAVKATDAEKIAAKRKKKKS